MSRSITGRIWVSPSSVFINSFTLRDKKMPHTCRATTQSLFPPAASLEAKGWWKGEQNEADPYNTYWPATEGNARLTQAVTWNNHKGIMLNERSQTPKACIAWLQLAEVQSELLSTEGRLGLPGVGRRNEKWMLTTVPSARWQYDCQTVILVLQHHEHTRWKDWCMILFQVNNANKNQVQAECELSMHKALSSVLSTCTKINK